MIKRNSKCEIMVIASKVKEYIANQGMRTSGDFIEALSKALEHKIDKAIRRAKEGRKAQTVTPGDI